MYKFFKLNLNFKPSRDAALDQMRGLAVLLMIGFHLVFDLNHFKLIQVDSKSIWMLGWRYFIVVSFLLAVGISLAASYRHIHFKKFAVRLGKLFLAALLVTVVTWLVFGDRFVYFGILHLILLASLVSFGLRHRPNIALCLGLMWFGLNVYDFSSFALVDNFLTNYWPNRSSVDYYPPIPWLGWVWVGIFLGHHRTGYQYIFSYHTTAIQWLGQHALFVYLTHQVVLFGGVFLLHLWVHY